MFAKADMEGKFCPDFGRSAQQHDPIVHFYETFLMAYDPHLRELRGVYYTPEPVVSYIVRSVDYLLKSHFDLPRGLTDTTTLESGTPRMLLLDPAVGTGTFLYGVIEYIRQQFQRQGNAGMWNIYVREHLLKQLHGFELLMVPYAVSHFKLAWQLAGRDLDEPERTKWSYDFANQERLNIYLTNSLEEAEKRNPDAVRFVADNYRGSQSRGLRSKRNCRYWWLWAIRLIRVIQPTVVGRPIMTASVSVPSSVS